MHMISPTVIFQAIVYGLLNGSIYALFSVGFTLIFGVMKIINFLYGQLTVVAMYITLFLFTYYKIDPFISMVFTVPIFFLIGIIIYKSAIRRMINVPHPIQMMATLGLFILVENLMLFVFKGTPRAIITSYTTSMLPLWAEVRINYPRLVAAMITLIVIMSLFIFLKKNDLGKNH